MSFSALVRSRLEALGLGQLPLLVLAVTRDHIDAVVVTGETGGQGHTATDREPLPQVAAGPFHTRYAAGHMAFVE